MAKQHPRQIVYWDSCVFIDWIQNTDPARVEMMRPVIEAAKRDDLLIVTSAWTLTEVVRCNGDQPMSDDEDARIREFFLSPFIELRPAMAQEWRIPAGAR